ncbi:MAG TPA: hypothetical protein VK029_10700 [Pseudogracilibacillus sp.]|nr:hypothetical protein [Pseudogracilibacillus sp.]
MQFSFIIFTFITPIIAGNMGSQRSLSIIALLLYIIGLFGLVQGSSILIPLSAIIIGLGAGSAFSLVMMFFTLRTSSGYEAAELSGIPQSVGYLLAAVGPILFGGVYDLTTNWTTPLVMLIVTSIICLFTGIGAGRNIVIENK